MTVPPVGTARSGVHPNAEILRSIYADLTRIGHYTSEDVILHTAERGVAGRPADRVGKSAVVAKERDLIDATLGTLVMDVQHITANDYFGAVLGILRARRNGDSIAMPFCGLWRFRDGLIVEHWENAHDPAELTRFFTNRT